MTIVNCSFIGTSNHGFSNYAQDEIRTILPGSKFTPLVPDEVYVMEIPASQAEALTKLHAKEPIFLRHIQPVNHQIGIDRSERDLEWVQQYIEGLTASWKGIRIAVQARKVNGVDFAYTPFAVKEAIDVVLTRKEAIPVVQDAELVISVFLAADQMYVGISTPADNLSDWSGGAIRFQREEEQISRAKFKLLEAEMKFALDFRQYSRALDIGAAPGGWSSLLLERGLSVTAVDPGHMHPSLVKHPRLTYLRKNANDVPFQSNEYDLLVCDMSWGPRPMCKLIQELSHVLITEGLAVITLKLMHKKPFQTVKEITRALESSFHLLKAKQLFHNREEITLLFKKVR